MAKKKKAPKAEADRRPVTIEPLEREHDGVVASPYHMMEQLIEEHHTHLIDARIAIAWRMSEVRADADGLLEFGRVKRAADLDRAFAPFDFVLVIAHEVWNRAEGAKDETRLWAMLDWLLCQCMPVMAGEEQAIDQKDRLCWRIRKPLKVFPENVGRFGLWNAEPIDEANKRFHDAQRKLLPKEDEVSGDPPVSRRRRNGFADPAIPPGATSTTTPGGIREHDPLAAGVGE